MSLSAFNSPELSNLYLMPHRVSVSELAHNLWAHFEMVALVRGEHKYGCNTGSPTPLNLSLPPQPPVQFLWSKHMVYGQYSKEPL
jgi:hypothetical protein